MEGRKASIGCWKVSPSPRVTVKRRSANEERPSLCCDGCHSKVWTKSSTKGSERREADEDDGNDGDAVRAAGEAKSPIVVEWTRSTKAPSNFATRLDCTRWFMTFVSMNWRMAILSFSFEEHSLGGHNLYGVNNVIVIVTMFVFLL